jgi:hypothetical protein
VVRPLDSARTRDGCTPIAAAAYADQVRANLIIFFNFHPYEAKSQ